MGIVFFISLCIGFILFVIFFTINKREEKKNEIERLQKNIKNGFDELLELSGRHGNELFTKLNSYSDKMDKLISSDIRKDIHQYDIYGQSILIKHHLSIVGYIVIDEDLIPKFTTLYYPYEDKHKKNIRLKAALTASQVRELAEKCRKIQMDADIEKYRKEKVEEKLK